MKSLLTMLIFCGVFICSARTVLSENERQQKEVLTTQKAIAYDSSADCRSCHEKFYQSWSVSRHGQAMKPYTAEFAQKQLTLQKGDIVIGKYRYRAEIGPHAGYVTEVGPKGKKRYGINHVLAGKNLFYFLTLLDNNRLQTLPVAYDISKKQWVTTAAGNVHHFVDWRGDESVHWTGQPYAFNSSCYGCHVSRFLAYYDVKTGAYSLVDTEPGIVCETCHGSAGEHSTTAQATPKGRSLAIKKIISVKTMTSEQQNHLCASCHAKTPVPLTPTYPPGEHFFDHYDLVTLDHPDYSADGRDRKENFTYTSWLLSPCAKSKEITCMHCHTAGGSYRFTEEATANQACMPCHAGQVRSPAAHTRHKPGSAGSKCISCHMPVASSGGTKARDHSMIPPAPSATMAFLSPNACNTCHSDKTAAWADKHVRGWQRHDYQAPLLDRARLIDAARKHDWKRLPDILAYITNKEHDEVFAASLIRLLKVSRDERLYPALLKALKDASPLVRASAAESLARWPLPETLPLLLEALGDEYRLVRLRAAAALAALSPEMLKEQDLKKIEKARKELFASLMVQPDTWTSRYTMGNYQLSRGEFNEAIASYETALIMEPRALPVMLSASIAYTRTGEYDKAETILNRALTLEPDNASAHLNLGLLKAELNDIGKAEKHLKSALRIDPQMAQAAYALCTVLSGERIDEALTYCKRAVDLALLEASYRYTLAFYQHQKGDSEGALKTLDALISIKPAYGDAYLLVGRVYDLQNKRDAAEKIYTKALETDGIPDRQKILIRAKRDALDAEGRVGGVYGARLPAASGPGRIVHLALNPDRSAEIRIIYFLSKPAFVETGKWGVDPAGLITVALTARAGQPYEKPDILKFIVGKDGLTSVEYDRDIWGTEGLHLQKEPDIAGKAWQLAEIQYLDDLTVKPDDPLRYTLEFSKDGMVAIKADCNRGTGRYVLAGRSFTVEYVAYTRAMCPPESLYDTFTEALAMSVSCEVRDGSLYLTMAQDKGTIKLVPLTKRQ